MGERNKRGSKPALRVVLFDQFEQNGSSASHDNSFKLPPSYRLLGDVEPLRELSLRLAKLISQFLNDCSSNSHDRYLHKRRLYCQHPKQIFFRHNHWMAVDLEIASRLREARRSSGYDSSAEAADAMDLAYTTYASHENGGRGVPAKSLSRYAAFYRVNLLWLAEGRGPMRGKAQDNMDILAGLPAEARQLALDYIEFLKAKFGV